MSEFVGRNMVHFSEIEIILCAGIWYNWGIVIDAKSEHSEGGHNILLQS